MQAFSSAFWRDLTRFCLTVRSLELYCRIRRQNSIMPSSERLSEGDAIMKFSHLLTTTAAAIIGSAALHAQQPADAAPPAQPNVEEETSGPDEAAISALEAAGITRRQYNSTLIATAYTGNDVTMPNPAGCRCRCKRPRLPHPRHGPACRCAGRAHCLLAGAYWSRRGCRHPEPRWRDRPFCGGQNGAHRVCACLGCRRL